MRQTSIFDELIVDNFAGGGGASTGIERAIGRPIDVAINHDPEAIEMHRANHPNTLHLCENVWEVHPREVANGRQVGMVWLSPDCKHFSKAKGGKPRDKNIRGLAWVAVRWAATVRPRVIFLENVEEFVTWCPLDQDGYPRLDQKGRTFRSFINALTRLGYHVEWRELRACNYGAPTTRKRLFLIARCDGQPIRWPDETHGPNGEQPYRTAAEIIDWSLPCPSIFERQKPLAEATMRRIARGVQKYVIDAKEPFIVTCNHGGEEFRGQGINEPFKTITSSRDAHGLVIPTLIQTGWGEHSKQNPRVPGLEKPLGTIMAQGTKHALVAAGLVQYNGENHDAKPRCCDITEPLNTITAGGKRHALFCAALIKHYGGNTKLSGMLPTKPVDTITAQDHHALIAASLVQHYGQSVGRSIEEPIPTITAGGQGKTGLIAAHLMRQFGTTTGSPLDEPMKTIMADGAGGKTGLVYAFLSKYFGKGTGQDLREPAATLTSKDRLALVTINAIDYVIADIGMRMLQPHELFLAQGFPADYIISPIVGGKPLSKTAQVRMVGNSVSPPVAEALVRANYQAA